METNATSGSSEVKFSFFEFSNVKKGGEETYAIAHVNLDAISSTSSKKYLNRKEEKEEQRRKRTITGRRN